MKRKISIFVMALVLIGIIAMGLLSNTLVRSNYVEGIEEQLVSNIVLFETTLEHHELTIEEIQKIASKFSGEQGIRITLIRDDGIVMVETNMDPSVMDDHSGRPEVKAAMSSGFGVVERYSNSTKDDRYYVAIKSEGVHPEISVIRFSLPLSKIRSNNMVILQQIFISAIFGLLITLLLGSRYLKVFLDPIHTMIDATKQIADGNFGDQVLIDSDDELGELAQNFNRMSGEIDSRMKEISDRNIKMNAILSSMINGVIAVDNNKNVMFINSTAAEMFNLDETRVPGMNILEIIRLHTLDDLLNDAIYEKKMSSIEIEYGNEPKKLLSIHSNPIIADDKSGLKIGVVILVQDITEIRKLEFMRRDFVANVSHELKTPLTSIKGFVETLKEGAIDSPGIRDRFLDIINIEADRLTSLIDDILILSEIEKREKMMTPIDMNKSIADVQLMLSELSKKKNIQLNFHIEENLPRIYGQKTWLKQMMINLTENAIKYTPDNGEVNVSARVINDTIEIRVKDNGIGIAESHMERLFERFYRVDKARSRSEGGTGLGLAIVKHVVLSLDGEIKVESELGKGTEFIVTFPKSPESNLDSLTLN